MNGREVAAGAPVTLATGAAGPVEAAARVLPPGRASCDRRTSDAARRDHFAAIVHRHIGGGGRPC